LGVWKDIVRRGKAKGEEPYSRVFGNMREREKASRVKQIKMTNGTEKSEHWGNNLTKKTRTRRYNIIFKRRG